MEFLLKFLFGPETALLFKGTPAPSRTGFVRVICKEKGADFRIPLALPDENRDKSVIDSLALSEGVAGYAARARVFFKYNPPHTPMDPQTVWVSFAGGEGLPEAGIVGLNRESIGGIYALLGAVQPAGGVLPALDRIIYRALSTPPADLGLRLSRLNDRTLQLVLNHLLARKIANTDMLGAYIHHLGEAGDRVLSNLSQNIQSDVKKALARQKVSGSYRFAREADFILSRNLLIAAREAEIRLPGLERTENLRAAYEAARVASQLTRKGIGEWLIEMRNRGLFRKLFGAVKRADLAAALAQAPEGSILTAFQGEVSAEGLSRLLDDRVHASRQPAGPRAHGVMRFMDALLRLYYEDASDPEAFATIAPELVKTPADLELVTDRAGFARVLYALSDSDPAWLKSILNGVFAELYEDVEKGLVIIQGYGEYRREECRKDFLEAALTLSGEGLIG